MPVTPSSTWMPLKREAGQQPTVGIEGLGDGHSHQRAGLPN